MANKRRRPWLLGCGLSLVLVLALLVGGVVLVGPSFGLYLTPATPQNYVPRALKVMENGYYATGPEWEEAKREARASGEHVHSFEEAWPIVEKAAKVAGGKHSFLDTTKKQKEQTPDPDPSIARDGRITTLVLPEHGGKVEADSRRYAETLAGGVRANADSCGFIVDLRGNRGGNMWPMVAGVAALIPDGEVMAFVPRQGSRTSVTVKGGEVKSGPSALARAEVGAKLDKPVAVLTDDQTASSGEAVLVAFRGLERARTFGAPSAGYSSANQGFPLEDGSVLQLTTALYADRTGRTYGDVIAPDEPTTEPERAARTWLESRCG